jgi:hypothetical protein
MIPLRSQLIFQMVTTEGVRGKSFPPAGFGAEPQLISVSLKMCINSVLSAGLVARRAAASGVSTAKNSVLFEIRISWVRTKTHDTVWRVFRQVRANASAQTHLHFFALNGDVFSFTDFRVGI